MSALLGTHPSRMNVLLVGKTGHGKSATGNAILQRKEFVAKCSTTSVTKFVTFGVNVIRNKEILVADTPGYADTDPDNFGGRTAAIQLVANQIRQALVECPQGYDAILYVTRFDIRYTSEEMETFQTIKKIIGGNSLRRHGILIFTHGDAFDTDEMKMSFGKWCHSQTKNLKKIFNGFGNNKAILMDNKTSDEAVKTTQLQRLIVKIDNSRRSLEYRRYTMYNFNAVELGRTQLLVSAKKEVESKRVDFKIAELTQKLNNTLSFRPSQKIASTRSIMNCIDEALQQVKEKDEETGILESEMNKLDILKGTAEDVYKKAIAEEAEEKRLRERMLQKQREEAEEKRLLRERVLQNQRLQQERDAEIHRHYMMREQERKFQEMQWRQQESARKKQEEEDKQWQDIEQVVKVGAFAISAIYSMFKSDDSDKKTKRKK